MKEVYVLMCDSDGTMHSIDRPFGVAVSSEDEAKRFVKEGKFGYTHSYEKLFIFDNKDDAIKWRFSQRRKETS